jgi:hypothetical protein
MLQYIIAQKLTCEDRGLIIHDGKKKDKAVAEVERIATCKHNEGLCFLRSDGLSMMRAHSRVSFYLAYTEYQSH